MKFHKFGPRVGDFTAGGRRDNVKADPVPPLPTVRTDTGTIHVYESLASEEELGTMEEQGAAFIVAFAGDDPQPFRFRTVEAALDYIAEFAWCRHLGIRDS